MEEEVTKKIVQERQVAFWKFKLAVPVQGLGQKQDSEEFVDIPFAGQREAVASSDLKGAQG